MVLTVDMGLVIKTCACGQPRHTRTKCKECMQKHRRAQNLRKKYNITVEQYEAMLSDQNGQCAICRSSDPKGAESFAVDHDHSCCPGSTSCGTCVRGLLCSSCNMALGLFGDRVTIMDRAASYVRGNRTRVREASRQQTE